MSGDLDALDRLVVTIVAVRRRFGDEPFRRALVAARVAVAAVVMEETERRAGVGVVREPCAVVRFPKGHRSKTRERRER